MPEIKSLKARTALAKFSDYALILARRADGEVEITYYDFPWEICAAKFFQKNYPFESLQTFNCFMITQPVATELRKGQEYLLETLARHHHAFSSEEISPWLTRGWEECREFIQKKLTKNCDKDFRDWLQFCEELAAAARSEKTCYYLKHGRAYYFENHFELFFSIKYGDRDKYSYLIVLTDDDIAQVKKLPAGEIFPDLPLAHRKTIRERLAAFLLKHDFLH